MSITEFLLARIAEDEASDTATHTIRFGLSGSRTFEERTSPSPRRLAECEAKRRIVEWCTDEAANHWEVGPVFGHLAAVYADHPDYRPEWAL